MEVAFGFWNLNTDWRTLQIPQPRRSLPCPSRALEGRPGLAGTASLPHASARQRWGSSAYPSWESQTPTLKVERQNTSPLVYPNPLNFTLLLTFDFRLHPRPPDAEPCCRGHQGRRREEGEGGEEGGEEKGGGREEAKNHKRKIIKNMHKN